MLIKLVVDRIEGNKAVLLTTEKESITWPITKLPQGTKEGAELQFKIVDGQGSDKELAKELLNEILDA